MTYADDFNLRTSTATAEDVADAVDGLLTAYQQQLHGTAISTTSTSSTVYTGSSKTVTVADGEIVEIIAVLVCSHGSSGGVVALTVEEDGVNLGNSSRWYSPTADTSGNIGTVNFHQISTPAAGSHTYKIKWNTVAAGTAYSSKATLIVKVLQNT